MELACELATVRMSVNDSLSGEQVAPELQNCS